MIIDVAVPYRVNKSLHYQIDEEVAKGLSLGSLVQVPFRQESTHAFVLGFPSSSPLKASQLRTVEAILHTEPLFSATVFRLAQWISDYYCHPLGEVLATIAPRNSWEKTRKKDWGSILPTADLSLLAGARPVLNDEQTEAVSRIRDTSDTRPFLLHGVTGSGKTEIYMAVLDTLLAVGRSAIIIVPEIALTPQLLARFSNRFPGVVALLHSDLKVSERKAQWWRVRLGEAKIIIGARSAVFAPAQNLGLIVVDEEHESTFKQEDSLRYHARDVAVVRANFEGCKIILGSATPSLESFANAQSGKYVYVSLKNRVQNRLLPSITFVDMKRTQSLSGLSWMSDLLLKRIERTLAAGSQTLLYLNRLGFAHFLYCDDCGQTWRCRNCDVSLTYYLRPPKLTCHYCGFLQKPPEKCTQCHGTKIRPIGVGTEHVETDLLVRFPRARIVRLDRSVVKSRRDLEAIIARIASKEVDIVIGTQLIAKGHDFPGITLVGILTADASLNFPDFRAYERTFQIITQVSGRAGRAESPGEVVIQTINPEHPVFTASAKGDYSRFYEDELSSRKRRGFPPFSRMAMLRFQHTNATRVEQFAKCVVAEMLGAIRSGQLTCHILGPAVAPLARLNKSYRWQCLIRGTSTTSVRKAIEFAQATVQGSKSTVQMAVDVDPISLL